MVLVFKYKRSYSVKSKVTSKIILKTNNGLLRRFLAKDTAMALQRAKVSSLRILAEPGEAATDQAQLSTISRTVTVEIASKTILDQALKGDIK